MSPSQARLMPGRQRVAPEQHDPEAVEHLRGRRIERRQVLDVGEPQRDDVPGLRETRRPREVVPERVEPADADVVGLDRERAPLGEHDGAGEQRHRGRRRGHRPAAPLRAVGGGPPACPASSRTPARPTSAQAITIGPSSNRPTVPSTSRIAISSASPMTTSASRAGGPVQSGERAPTDRHRGDREPADHDDERHRAQRVAGDARVHARHHRIRSGSRDSTGPLGGWSRYAA